jgi:ABC-type bacteriocin/lantibiotic exporter with double-glycine peptidase domain
MRRIDGSPLTWLAGAVLVTTLSVRCAGPASSGAPEAAQAPSEPTAHYIRGVPFVPGEPGACGPAALASVLAYRGEPVTVEEIARVIAAPSLAGVLPMDLERFAASRGATAHTTRGSLAWLRERLARDQPVVAFLDLGIGPVRQGHFVVVVGYDNHAGRVLLYSGMDADAAMSYRRFTAAWRRTDFWALSFEPPAGDDVSERSAS